MNASDYREEIYDVFAGSGDAVATQVDRALEIGTSYLGLPIGFLTRIDDGQQTIVAATGEHDLIQLGESCPMEQAYCRRTLETDGSLAPGRRRLVGGVPASHRQVRARNVHRRHRHRRRRELRDGLFRGGDGT